MGFGVGECAAGLFVYFYAADDEVGEGFGFDEPAPDAECGEFVLFAAAGPGFPELFPLLGMGWVGDVYGLVFAVGWVVGADVVVLVDLFSFGVGEAGEFGAALVDECLPALGEEGVDAGFAVFGPVVDDEAVCFVFVEPA